MSGKVISTFQEFFNRLCQRGLEYFGLYYSIYRGEVVSNEDPEKLGRLKVSVPQVYGEEIPEYWATPYGMAAAGVNSGIFDIPEAGDPVYVQFEMGRPSKPVWSPGWWGMKGGENEVPWNARHCPPKVSSWRQKCGHRIEFDNRDGNQRVIVIASDGSYLDIDVQRKKIGIRAKSDRHDQTDGDKVCYTEGNSEEYAGGDKSKVISGSELSSIGADKSESISGNSITSIGGNKSETITGNFTKTITGNESETITGKRDLIINGGWNIEVTGPLNITTKMGIAPGGGAIMNDITFYAEGMGKINLKGSRVKINDMDIIAPMPIIPVQAETPQHHSKKRL